MKKPWLAALLNFFLWGMGYVYAGRRVLFGVLMLFAGMIQTVWAFFQGIDFVLQPVYFTTTMLAAVAFSYDGYRSAREVNRIKLGFYP